MRDKTDIKVCIVDYGLGNLRSVYNKVADICLDPVLSSNPKDIMAAEKLILPGVGHFAQGMKNLESFGIREALEEKVIAQGTPILGICLGMQLFTSHSEEGDCNGLGWIEAETRRFDKQAISNPHFKTPHMGWNTLDVTTAGEDVFGSVDAQDELYFCHSYYVDCPQDHLVTAYADYGLRFVASVAKDNIIGMQFHPEKSHDIGAKLISDFIHAAELEVLKKSA